MSVLTQTTILTKRTEKIARKQVYSEKSITFVELTFQKMTFIGISKLCGGRAIFPLD